MITFDDIKTEDFRNGEHLKEVRQRGPHRKVELRLGVIHPISMRSPTEENPRCSPHALKMIIWNKLYGDLAVIVNRMPPCRTGDVWGDEINKAREKLKELLTPPPPPE